MHDLINPKKKISHKNVLNIGKVKSILSEIAIGMVRLFLSNCSDAFRVLVNEMIRNSEKMVKQYLLHFL